MKTEQMHDVRRSIRSSPPPYASECEESRWITGKEREEGIEERKEREAEASEGFETASSDLCRREETKEGKERKKEDGELVICVLIPSGGARKIN